MKTLSQPTGQSESVSVHVALHPFLAGMNPTQLALLRDCAIAVHFKKGQTILREGELANRFYLMSEACAAGLTFGRVSNASVQAYFEARHNPLSMLRDLAGLPHDGDFLRRATVAFEK